MYLAVITGGKLVKIFQVIRFFKVKKNVIYPSQIKVSDTVPRQ